MAIDPKLFRAFCETVSDLLAEKRAQEDTMEAELEELRREIVGLEQALSAAAPFTSGMKITVGDVAIVDGVAQLNLADAVRKVLDHNSQARTARGIRDSLSVSGYNLTQHNNPLASIHGVLKRMADSGEIDTVEMNGKTRYRSKSARVTGFSGYNTNTPLPMHTRSHPAYGETTTEPPPVALKTQSPPYVTLPDPPMPPRRYRVTPKEVKKKD